MRHLYADFIERVAKPARYLGGEYMSVVKRPEDVDVRIALAFPDVYDIGMSHLGTKILYALLNKHPRIAAERVFAPWIDMEAELRAAACRWSRSRPRRPLLRLRRGRLLAAVRADVHQRADACSTSAASRCARADRGDDDPLVIAGGPTATHPEPMAPFIDAVAASATARRSCPSVAARLGAHAQGRACRAASAWSRWPQLGARVRALALRHRDRRRRPAWSCVGAPLDPRVPRARPPRAWSRTSTSIRSRPTARSPYAEAVFDRVSVEIARGCTEGCRFCQAGMIYRPVRERSPQSIVETRGRRRRRRPATTRPRSPACRTADFSCITPLVQQRHRPSSRTRKRRRCRSSSLRAYGLNEELLDEIGRARASAA